MGTRFFKMFSMQFNLEGEEIVPKTTVIDEGSTENNQDSVIVDTLDTYVGSKEVNPEGKPLKNFDRTFYNSKEEIDFFIKQAGESIFLPEDIIKKQKEEKVIDKDKKKEDTKKTDEKTEKTEDAVVDEEKEAEKFLSDIGLSKEDFLKLPEKVQEKLATEQIPDGKQNVEYETISKKYTDLTNDVIELKKDPVIAARIEEKRTGKKYVATDLPEISGKEVDKLIELSGDKEEFIAAINELMVKKSHDVLKIERGVVERIAEREKNEKEAAKVLQTIIDKEPRFGITEKDITKIDENHPEYEKLFGKGGIMEELKRKRYSPLQLVAKGADELLKEFAGSKGWDKEKEQKIYKQGRNSILDTLRKAKTVARTLEVGKQSLGKNTDSTHGFDRASLISDIASGKTSQWSKLISDADRLGNIKLRTQLNEIYEEALRKEAKQ
jgi:hypothetical protein